ncbi:FAD-binding protein [Candidatus Saccharibacteria bacterium]|nr:FAD-binding protein [Candidatus Saccharibacteria bacterium]NCU40810.1 FAD-binding protein [Candidatus Saccharibacteria bacterium]
MKSHQNISLAQFTSLSVGGYAEELILPDNYDELKILIENNPQANILGYGCNVLISDSGLPGTTIALRNGSITIDGTLVIADSGVWWDDMVQTVINNHLWGFELMSEVPSSVGGAVFGNIACYGQQVSDTLSWVEVFDRTDGKIYKLLKKDIDMSYRSSVFQQRPELVILRAAYDLSLEPKQELTYDSALAIGEELGLDHKTLADCRAIIIETRRRAGSIYHYDDPSVEHSAGSFFRNPLVSTDLATELAKFDESGKTLERIQHQSLVHGGDTHRASAAHVLLASGFKRGQSWGPVQLHDKHVLKIVTHEGATATQVYDVVQEIVTTVSDKLAIQLDPEVKFVGKF